jgi:hypothetical protein
MAYARQQHPELYNSYQDFRRNGVGKAAPTTFESLVAAEMAKGVTHEVAAQRVMQLYGSAALEHRDMSKREATATLAEDQLLKRAESIWEDGQLDRCESLREARKQHPRLFKAMR